MDQSDTSTLIVIDRSGPVDYSAIVREVQGGWPKLRRLVVLGDDRPDGSIGWDDLLAAGGAVDDATMSARASCGARR